MPFQDCCENCMALPRVGDFAAVPVPFTYCLRLFVSAFITTKSCFGFLFVLSYFDVELCKFGSVYLAHEKTACRAGDACCSCG